MRKDVLLFAAGTIMSVWAPVSASAGTCDGALSWLCFNADSEAPVSTQTTGGGRSAAETQASEVGTCLTQDQVRGGYPRYRVINGRHCWYASVKARRKRQERAESRPKHHERAVKRAEVDVNPYDDPIWQEADATNSNSASCETQALKLDDDEKRRFLRDCNRR
jgi:hypothetical protein